MQSKIICMYGSVCNIMISAMKKPKWEVTLEYGYHVRMEQRSVGFSVNIIRFRTFLWKADNLFKMNLQKSAKYTCKVTNKGPSLIAASDKYKFLNIIWLAIWYRINPSHIGYFQDALLKWKARLICEVYINIQHIFIVLIVQLWVENL